MRVVNMIACGFRLGVILPVVMTLTISAPPAMADNIGSVFGGMLGTMIVLGAQEAAKSQQQTELQRQQAAKQRQILAKKQAEYKRAQTALKALGFYQKAIDGDWGSGSKSALAAYQRAFNLPQTDFSESTLATLEQIAAEGWRSADEFQQAQAGGFYNRDELVAARAGGFQVRSEWQAASAAGFDNRADYQDFARSEFGDPASYLQAKAGGFVSPSDYAEASKLGFDRADEFYAFRSGGYASKAQFDMAMETRAAADSARISCTDTSEYLDPIDRDTACQLALTVYPNDPGVASFAQAARDDLAAERHNLPLQIDRTQRNLTLLLSNPDKLPKLELDTKIAGLRSDLDELSLRRALVTLQDNKVECSSAMSRQDWNAARVACDAALAQASETVGVDANPELVQELRLMASKADDQARLVAEQAAKEKARLAISAANDKSITLIEDVTSYSAEGYEFGEGLKVARALVALNMALENQAPEAIENAYGELSRLVAAEDGFVTYRANKIAAAKQVEASTAVAARRDSENLNGFLKDYISHNLTAANIGELLDLQARLESTLQKGNAVEIASLLATARQTVFTSGLNQQLDAYVNALGAPIVTDDVLAQKQAEQKAQSIEIATAESKAADLVEEVGAYSEAGARFADPLAVGRALVALREALSAGEASAIVQRADAMEAVLAGDTAFQASRQERSVANAQSRQNAQVLAGETAQLYSAFLVEFIANNITSPDIATLIALQDQIDAAIKLEDWQQIMNANTAVEDYLGANSLQTEYAQFAALQKAKQDGGPQVAAADNGIALNAANSELLSGDDADILVLKNAGGSAPNMAVNLLGNLTFDNSTAKTCWLNPPPAISTAMLLMQNSLRQLGAARLSGGGQCGPDYMSAVDLVLVERGGFLKRSATEARPAILDFELGRLSTLVAITKQQVSEFEQTLANSSRQLADQINAEEKQGFGLIYLADGEGDICFASDADAYANANLLAGQRSVLQFYYGAGTPNLTPVMLDRSFVLAQRGACSGIYADAQSLKQLLAGLDRENVQHLLVPLWISNQDYTTELAQIDETNQQREARLEAQRQKAAAEAELQRQQNQTAEKLRLAAQDKMREENRTKAVGAAKDLGTMAMAFVEGGSTQFAKLFPEIAQTRSQQGYDKWQVTSNSYTLKDYGTALWQNRRVPAVFIEMRYQSENAVLGLYREDCSVVGYLIDEEFSQTRDPVETVCVNTATIEEWKTGHMFESGWYAK